MSNEQQQWPEPTPRPEPQQSGPTFQQSGPSYQHSGPSFQQAGTPQYQQSYGAYSQSGPQGASYQSGGYSQPRPTSYPNPNPQPATQPSAPRKQKRGVGMAGVLTIAVLAAGIGGGSGFVASRYLEPGITAGGATSSPSASPSASPTETTETESGGQQTTVVQADPTNPDWATVAEVASQAVVAIQVSGSGSGSQGSGVIISGDGYIVTNNHVVASSGANAQITVFLGNTAYQAEAVGYDSATDLAVIKLTDPPSDLAVMGYGDAKALQVGDPVMAIGNPLGLADTVTTGIVSALNRPVTTRAVTNETVSQMSRDNRVVTAAIQTNAAINPGNSGGALVNTAGELVGITSSIATLSSSSDQSGNIGIGFAIGADQVEYVVEQLIATGTAEHPQLGISATDVQTYGPMGAEVAEVVPGSPAEAAGLQVGDQIIAIDGQDVSSSESLVALVRAGRVGVKMQVTLLRAGEELTLPVIPIAAPN